MLEKIKELYENINFIGFYCTYNKKNQYIEKIKEVLPEVQEFSKWFLAGNTFDIDEETYYALQQNLLEILEDCAEALKENDRVLMMDALEQGILGYLEMFLPEE